MTWGYVGAQTQGYGCLVGNTVYMQYLGEGYPYGTGSQKLKYYKSNGPSAGLNYNNYSSTKPNNYNYECGKINVFSASGGNPAQQEYTTQNASCITSSDLGGPVSGNGTYVYYSYNNPTYCASSPPTQVPLDGQIWMLLLAVGAIGALMIRNGLFQAKPNP